MKKTLLTHNKEQTKRLGRRIASYLKPGDVVLLSPACASFDAFANFAERGRTFCAIVKGFETENG